MTEKKIRPLGHRVLVKRAQSASRKGGILLPDSAQEKPQVGEVIAVGPGRQEEDGSCRPLDVKIGDKVLFSPYSGTSVKQGDSEPSDYLLMSEDDILALVH